MLESPKVYILSNSPEQPTSTICWPAEPPNSTRVGIYTIFDKDANMLYVGRSSFIWAATPRLFWRRRTPITLPRKIAHERENFSTGRLWGCPWSAIVSSTKSMWADCARRLERTFGSPLTCNFLAAHRFGVYRINYLRGMSDCISEALEAGLKFMKRAQNKKQPRILVE
jgi:hypothetical protein